MTDAPDFFHHGEMFRTSSVYLWNIHAVSASLYLDRYPRYVNSYTQYIIEVPLWEVNRKLGVF